MCAERTAGVGVLGDEGVEEGEGEGEDGDGDGDGDGEGGGGFESNRPNTPRLLSSMGWKRRRARREP